ncbi:MAG: hypothetical protein WC217_00420 [Candidatus Paceibacterota bacterium]
MAHLVFILVSLALLIGFFALTWYEERRGTRLFALGRTRFDQRVARIEFILEHVDLGAFVRDEIHRVISRVGHDIVHLSLQAVRTAERLLTRLVRHLRTRHAVDTAPRETSRPFVQSLSDFKDRLKATRPEVPDVHDITSS